MPETTRRDPLGLVAGGEGTITGTVVCAAVIAYAGSHTDSVWQLTWAILGTVGVYWVAHLHAVTIGSSLTHRHHPVAAIRHAFTETWPIVGASVLPLGALWVSTLLGAELLTAAWIALITTIVLLTAYSYVAGVRGGLDTWGRIGAAAAGAALGILVALLKIALH
ncbi:MAG: hypothetical protein WBP61_11095 [Nocardioides sp.]